jgi:hypothetical protein
MSGDTNAPDTTGSLERRYRRLLLAYPRRYRRSHGDEIVATLLDGARAGQQHPTRRETVNLLGNGLRRRYCPAPGLLPHLAAALVAVVVAALGVAVGTWLGWQAASSPLPTDDQALAVAHSATAGLSPAGPPDRFDVVFDYDAGDPGGPPDTLPFPVNVLVGGDDYSHGWVDVTYRRPTAAVEGDVTAIHERLAADGWRVGPVHTQPRGPQRADVEFHAWRGTDLLTVSTSAINATVNAYSTQWHTQEPAERSVVFSFARAEPTGVRPIGYALGLAGLFAGWILAARVSRLTRQQGTAVRTRHLFRTTLGLTATLPTSVATLLHFLTRPARRPAGHPDEYWLLYVQFPLSTTYTLGAVSLVAACLLLAMNRAPAQATPTLTTVHPASAAPGPATPMAPRAGLAMATAIVATPPIALVATAIAAAIGAAFGL